MPLTQTEAVALLLGQGLLPAEAIVENDLTMTDASRRNQNYKVQRERGPSFLVKQGEPGEQTDTLGHEAAILAALQEEPCYRGFIPRLSHYDPTRSLLILELFPDARDVREYHTRLGRFPTGLAAAIGALLGRLHRLPIPRPLQKDGPSGPGPTAWALSAHRPALQFLYTESGAQLELVRIIQQHPDFCALLEELRSAWRPTTLLHGDIRWDNFLVTGKATDSWTSRIKLVDWELAYVGDPRWEAAAVFQSYLSFWVQSMPITGQTPPERFTELVRYPLHRIQPAMRAFWQAYVTEMGLDETTADSWLLLATRCCGAGLIQAAYELTQASTRLTGDVICLLQLGWNILARPEGAATQLLGISPGKGRRS